MKLNEQEEEGNTALLEAVRGFHCPIIEYLLEQGADPKITDRQRISVLHYISMSQSETPDLVDMLLSRGADINAQDNSGRTVLHSELNTHGGIVCTKFLMSRGARANILDKDGRGEFHHLILGQRAGPRTLGFLKEKGLDAHIKDKEAATLLHYAVRNQAETPVLQFLLECGIDINATDNTGSTAVPYALEKYEGWKTLDWSPNKRRFGKRSYKFVCRGIEEVKFLLENGAAVSATDANLMTSLHRILQRTDDYSERLPEIVEKLLEHKADPLAVDSLGRNVIEVCLDVSKPKGAFDLHGGRERHEALRFIIKSCGGLVNLDEELRGRVVSFGFRESLV